MKIFEDIKVHIVKRPELFDSADVYIVQKIGSEVQLASVKDNILEFKTIKEGVTPASPTIQIPLSIMQKLIDAFSEAQPPTKQIEVDAELKATKYHLEDLRKLVFKGKE